MISCRGVECPGVKVSECQGNRCIRVTGINTNTRGAGLDANPMWRNHERPGGKSAAAGSRRSPEEALGASEMMVVPGSENRACRSYPADGRHGAKQK